MSTWWKTIGDLDADQRKVVGLPKDGDHLILGPAGCGKTNLLLLRATFLVKAGISDVLVLTFGRVLKEFLIAGATNYPFSTDKVRTYLQWGYSMLTANGVTIDDSGDFVAKRERLLKGLAEVAAMCKSVNVTDCILLDEAQDYSAAEIEVLGSFAKQIYAVGDDRQRVTGALGGLKALEARCGAPVELKHHYRNGVKICRAADGIRNEVDAEEGMEASSKYDEGALESSVIQHAHLSLPDQVAAAVSEIQNQLFAYPEEAIGVLCPRQEDANAVAAMLLSSVIKDQVQAQSFLEGYSAFSPDKRVVVTTIVSAKGLEFRAVHLLGMESVHRFRSLQKNLAYTGVTRAKTSLHIYYDRSIPGYLERGLNALSAPASDPALDDLFL